MSGLISKEALIKELNELRRYVPVPSYKDVFDIIMKAKAIEQGEAVIDKAAYDGAREDLSIWKRIALEAEEKVRKYDQRIVDIGVIAMTPVTTPQQSQSVADALEEFAKSIKELCSDYSSRNGSVYIGDVESAIDHLLKQHLPIKRNAKGVE